MKRLRTDDLVPPSLIDYALCQAADDLVEHRADWGRHEDECSRPDFLKRLAEMDSRWMLTTVPLIDVIHWPRSQQDVLVPRTVRRGVLSVHR